MSPKIRIRELKPLNLEGGFLIDGFPSIGFTSAIATESLIHTSQFELAGIIDSESFPPISVIKNGKPNFPTRIFVNEDWAKEHKIGIIVSSVAIKSSNNDKEIIGIGSTDIARTKIKEAGLKILDHGTIPGIPGMLLNEGSISKQDVIVIVFHTDGKEPDFKSSAQLCMAISKLIPGASCNIPLLQKEAEKAEIVIKETQEESKHLKDSMYR